MKTLIWIIFTIAMFGISCSNQNSSETANTEPREEINPESTVLIDLDVKGMTCTGCENTIKSGVSELDGVVSVEASHSDEKTIVKVDTSLTSSTRISEVIASKGYEVVNSKVKSLQ